MAKISIIIPIYNVEQYVEQCIKSVITQSMKDIEIICVNDCGQDNSMRIVERYAAKDNRIKILHHKNNKGLGPARNTGLKYASGEYVMFLDSDDWLEKDACEIAYKQISQNNNDFTFFGIYTFYEETKEKVINNDRLLAFMGNIWNKNITINDLSKPFMSYCECWYKIYNLKFIKNFKITFTDSKCYFEDQPFYFKVLLYSNNFSVIDKPLYNYRIREKSISQSVESWDSLLETRKKILVELKNLHNVSDKFIKFYFISCYYSLLGYYKRFSNLDKKRIYYMYSSMREFFILLNNYIDVTQINDFNEVNSIRKIIKYNYKCFKLYQFIKQIFNLYNIQVQNEKIKILNFLGLSIIVKKEFCNKI